MTHREGFDCKFTAPLSPGKIMRRRMGGGYFRAAVSSYRPVQSECAYAVRNSKVQSSNHHTEAPVSRARSCT